MMLFSQPSGQRDPAKMKKAIPFMKKIKFFAQREIEDEDYLLLSKCPPLLLKHNLVNGFVCEKRSNT
jgi:hypothetical protein